ncbi:MAG: hypothetical protein ACLFV5_05540 [Anaerolineales bacterium]
MDRETIMRLLGVDDWVTVWWLFEGLNVPAIGRELETRFGERNRELAQAVHDRLKGEEEVMQALSEGEHERAQEIWDGLEAEEEGGEPDGEIWELDDEARESFLEEAREMDRECFPVAVYYVHPNADLESWESVLEEADGIESIEPLSGWDRWKMVCRVWYGEARYTYFVD